MIERNNKNIKAGDFLKQFTYKPELAYPSGKIYLSLNTEYKKLKKETQIRYAKDYEVIISNSNHRELVFHGVYCILSPKEYSLIVNLLLNYSFNNENFAQLNFTEKSFKNVKVEITKKNSNKKLNLKRKFRKLFSKNSIYYVALKDKNKLLNIIKILRGKVKQKKLTINSKKSFSDNKTEIYNIKNKIKNKLKNSMLCQDVIVEDFEQKFEHFIGTINYNYYSEYPNPYATLRTSYNIKIVIPRLKRPKKS